MMFKILIVQTQHSLSDDRMEFRFASLRGLINDRLSFMQFLGLGLEGNV